MSLAQLAQCVFLTFCGRGGVTRRETVGLQWICRRLDQGSGVLSDLDCASIWKHMTEHGADVRICFCSSYPSFVFAWHCGAHVVILRRYSVYGSMTEPPNPQVRSFAMTVAFL